MMRKKRRIPTTGTAQGECHQNPTQSETRGRAPSSMRENRESSCVAQKELGRPGKPVRHKPGKEHEQSDEPVVPTKAPNKTRRCVAEELEGSGSPKRNTDEANGTRAQNRTTPPDGLERVRLRAKSDKDVKFEALLHHVTLRRLKEAFYKLNRKASAGVDKTTWYEYEENLDENLEVLLKGIHTGSYKARPSRRVQIPKPDGGERLLGVAAVQDKVIQKAIVEVLNAIYEQDFLGFSYGFRPHRNPHQALDALYVGIGKRKISYVLDADISKFFDNMSHEWIMKFAQHRIGDKRVLRLIKKWLTAGVIENENWEKTKRGTIQGASVSPLLANMYLHYAFDQWSHQWRKRSARGEVIIVRYADDITAGFQYKEDAECFKAEMSERLAKFNLALHPDKTRIIEFGRFATENRKRRGLGKPETFDFLGFTHISGKNRNGKFLIRRKTIKKRLRRKLQEVKGKLRKRMHDTVEEQGRWLRSVINGYYNYHAVPTNMDAMQQFRTQIARYWYQTLRRRSQKTKVTWKWLTPHTGKWLPFPRCRRSFPVASALTQGRSPVQ